MKRIKSGIILFLLLFLFWVLLAGTGRNEIIVGGLISAVLSLLFSPRVSKMGCLKLNPKAIFFMFLYILVFFRELIKSTFDVARRVISKNLPINPGIVKVKTKLSCPVGRTILANSITLTPGTMTVETKGEYFYIHWIDIQSDNIQEATESIVSTFEKYLEVIFE